MDNYIIKTAKGLEHNRDAALVRQMVFIYEQGFKNEFDSHDTEAIHTVIYDGGYPCATGRLIWNTEQNAKVAHIGRIAVIKAYRKKGLGQIAMQELEKAAVSIGANEIQLSAQLHAVPFYEKQGYECYGDTYYDEFCEHIAMIKKL